MSGRRVLIVDDHPGFRAAARELLLARGYTGVAEADGESSALEAVARFAPDLVMLDVILERENGFDVARALTRAQPNLGVLLVGQGGRGVSRACARMRSSRIRAQTSATPERPGAALGHVIVRAPSYRHSGRAYSQGNRCQLTHCRLPLDAAVSEACAIRSPNAQQDGLQLFRSVHSYMKRVDVSQTRASTIRRRVVAGTAGGAVRIPPSRRRKRLAVRGSAAAVARPSQAERGRSAGGRLTRRRCRPRPHATSPPSQPRQRIVPA